MKHTAPRKSIHFDKRPEEIKRYLGDYVKTMGTDIAPEAVDAIINDKKNKSFITAINSGLKLVDQYESEGKPWEIESDVTCKRRVEENDRKLIHYLTTHDIKFEIGEEVEVKILLNHSTFRGFHIKGYLTLGGLMELVITSPIMALWFVLDVLQRDVKIDTNDDLMRVFTSSFGHEFAREFAHFEHEEKKSTHDDINSLAKRELSTALRIAMGHQLVRYFFKTEPDSLRKIIEKLNENDLAAVKENFSDLFSVEEKTAAKFIR